MRNYETLIMETLIGETPKQKFDYLNSLLQINKHKTQGIENCITYLEQIKYSANIDRTVNEVQVAVDELKKYL